MNLSFCGNCKKLATSKRGGICSNCFLPKKTISKHDLGQTYRQMMSRCFDKNSDNFARYGALGITVCERWRGEIGFWNFVEDMGERPQGKTLDRIDGSKGYCPENCRWATHSEQQKNRWRSRPPGKSGKYRIYFDKDRPRCWRAYYEAKKFKSFRTLQEAEDFLESYNERKSKRVERVVMAAERTDSFGADLQDSQRGETMGSKLPRKIED